MNARDGSVTLMYAFGNGTNRDDRCGSTSPYECPIHHDMFRCTVMQAKASHCTTHAIRLLYVSGHLKIFCREGFLRTISENRTTLLSETFVSYCKRSMIITRRPYPIVFKHSYRKTYTDTSIFFIFYIPNGSSNRIGYLNFFSNCFVHLKSQQ
jgi:hypothetical protein